MASVVNTASREATLYSPLKDSDEIRLLYLQPHSAGEAVQCSLKHVKLTDHPPYEALSYMWGQKISAPVTIDSTVYEVRENLASALSHLRLDYEERVLWADALCINQTDVRERNHQVMQMGAIYETASRVIIWLGPSDPRLSLAIWSLQRDNYWNFDGKVATAITPLFTHQYWTRLWIIQEVLLARELSIQCGFDSLLQSSWSPLNYSRSLLQNDNQLKPLELLNDHSDRLIKAKTSVPLLELFRKHHRTRCEDILDKIFGLRALTHRCCRDKVVVNYFMHWEDLCAEVLAHYLLQHLPAGSNLHVSVAQGFNKDAKVARDIFHNPEKPLPPNKLLSPLQPDGDLVSQGYYGTCICFVTPILNQHFDKELQDLPQLYSHLRDYLKLADVNETGNPTTTLRNITSQIDLVWSSHSTVSYVIGVPEIEVPTSPKTTNLRYATVLWWLSSKASGAILGNSSILRTCSKTFRLAFADNGLICFAPNEAKVGDLIYRFYNSDVLAVIRPLLVHGNHTPAGRIIGRAVDSLSSSEQRPEFRIQAPENWQQSRSQLPLRFHIDFHTLYMMTRVSTACA
jgi:hypothetical protein